jgi:hypothetical protein
MRDGGPGASRATTIPPSKTHNLQMFAVHEQYTHSQRRGARDHTYDPPPDARAERPAAAMPHVAAPTPAHSRGRPSSPSRSLSRSRPASRRRSRSRRTSPHDSGDTDEDDNGKMHEAKNDKLLKELLKENRDLKAAAGQQVRSSSPNSLPAAVDDSSTIASESAINTLDAEVKADEKAIGLLRPAASHPAIADALEKLVEALALKRTQLQQLRDGDRSTHQKLLHRTGLLRKAQTRHDKLSAKILGIDEELQEVQARRDKTQEEWGISHCDLQQTKHQVSVLQLLQSRETLPMAIGVAAPTVFADMPAAIDKVSAQLALVRDNPATGTETRAELAEIERHWQQMCLFMGKATLLASSMPSPAPPVPDVSLALVPIPPAAPTPLAAPLAAPLPAAPQLPPTATPPASSVQGPAFVPDDPAVALQALRDDNRSKKRPAEQGLEKADVSGLDADSEMPVA